MLTLKEVLATASQEKKAIGHFNISTIEVLWAIFNAAREVDVPILIGTSEGERKFIGVRQVASLVRSLREEFEYPIFLNADHTYSFEGVKEAVDAGYDAVIFDGAKLSFEENVEISKKCVEYARSVNPEIVVEGELGYIGESSKLLDEVPERAMKEGMTTREQAEEYVRQAGVDLFSPSVGNLHGMLKHAKNPNLDIERISEIRGATGVPLVLHGGSGVSDEDFSSAIKAGINVVHINTEIRRAWREGLEGAMQGDPEQVAPYKLLKPAKEAVREVVKKRLELFSE
jgi:fructose-bisphosphate aldolase, class II